MRQLVHTSPSGVPRHKMSGKRSPLIPMRSAHTDGDTLVSFPGHDILAVGDYFRSTGYPFVELNNGGSLEGLLAALTERYRARWSDDQDHTGAWPHR